MTRQTGLQTELVNALHVMNAGQQLTPEVARELDSHIAAALHQHALQLDLDGVDVALFADGWVIPELGLSGYAPNGHTVLLRVDPLNSHFEPCWRQELPLMLGHELHHVKRWRGPGYGSTLLEALVTEGLAQHYEAGERGETPLYARPHDNMNGLWARATTQLDGTYDHNAWFFGSESQNLPRWAGYALGYELVRRFLLVGGEDAVTHVNTPADSFRQAWTGH